MPTILYAEHHHTDQVLNDLLATMRVADPAQPIQSAAPSANVTAAKPKVPASGAGPPPHAPASGALRRVPPTLMSAHHPHPAPRSARTLHRASHVTQGVPGGRATQIQPAEPCRRRRAPRAAYVVYEGLEPGIYTSWDDVEPLVSSISHANFEGFEHHIQAERAYIVAYAMGAIRRLPPKDAPVGFVPAAVAMPANLVQKLAALPANYLHAEWYVVFKGRAPGVYPTWGMTLTQVTGVSLAAFQRYPSKPEAEAAFVAARRAGHVQRL